jgi:hypothetical protein
MDFQRTELRDLDEFGEDCMCLEYPSDDPDMYHNQFVPITPVTLVQN